MIRIGVDPGRLGYICAIKWDKQKIDYFAIPLIGGKVDLQSLDAIFVYLGSHEDAKCVLEDIHAIYNSSAKATFSFGWIQGVLEAMLVSHGISYTKVAPKEWQKQMHEGIPKITKQGKTSTDTKAMSLLAAKRLFPNEDLRSTERCNKPHDGKVDALLLAEYARRHF